MVLYAFPYWNSGILYKLFSINKFLHSAQMHAVKWLYENEKILLYNDQFLPEIFTDMKSLPLNEFVFGELSCCADRYQHHLNLCHIIPAGRVSIKISHFLWQLYNKLIYKEIPIDGTRRSFSAIHLQCAKII